MILSDPTPDSFHLDQVQIIGSHSSYHPQIYAFDAAVSLAGAATFATVQVPGVKSKDGAEVNISQDVDLSNVTAFSDYSKAIMLNEEIQMNVYGKPKLKEGGLPKVTVTYDKTVTMKGKRTHCSNLSVLPIGSGIPSDYCLLTYVFHAGLNKLKGFDVVDFEIMKNLSAPRNMNGTVYIPNPSVLTLYMVCLTKVCKYEVLHVNARLFSSFREMSLLILRRTAQSWVNPISMTSSSNLETTQSQ